MQDAFAKGGKQVEYHDYYKYRISYITEKDQELMFLFVTGLTDNFENIKKELIKCKKEFLNLFEDILQHKVDAKTFEIFDPTIDSIHRNLRPKISLVGFSGVGKTTITRLIKAEEIPMEHIPTITGDIATIKIGKLHFHLWDFAGQEQFSYLWNNFIKGSDAVLLITDSSLENVEKSKFFLELIKEQAPQAHTSVIGNKQDLDTSMKPEQIEKILGLKTYSMIAKDRGNRDKMITIIADILEMSAEVSPLLQPLLERDIYTEKALQALEGAKFDDAVMYFEKISDLCIELGDDSLGKEFYEKSQKIKTLLQQSSSAQKAPVDQPKAIETSPKVIEPPKPKEEPPEPKEEPPEPKEEPPKPKEESPVLKKVAMPGGPKIEDLIKPKVPIAVPPPSGPPKKIPDVKKEQLQEIPTKAMDEKVINDQIILAKVAIPSSSNLNEQPETLKEEKPSEPELIIKPNIQHANVGLNLNPEDFMIKQRPKTVTVIPKDAKNKLKTSPFAHVSNPSGPKIPIPVSPTEFEKIKTPSGFIPPSKSEKTKVQTKPNIPTKEPTEIPKKSAPPPIPVSPTTLIKTKEQEISVKPNNIPTSIKPPEILQKVEKSLTQTPPEVANKQQKAELEKSLIDLRIKKANITRMSLDFDMKELTGEITPEELETKKQKLKTIEANIDQQIHDLRKLLEQ
jgi:small GTP-binding protein